MRALARTFKTLITFYPKNYANKTKQEFTLHPRTLHKAAELAGQAPMNDLPSSEYHMRQNQIFEILSGLFLQLKVRISSVVFYSDSKI